MWRSHALEGVSFAHTFDAADAATNHTTQYFEMFGHRSIYHDGWRGVCPWPGPNYTEAAKLGRNVGDPITSEVLDQLDRDGWELYHVAEDPSESRNVAAEQPDRLRELISLWWKEAERYKVGCPSTARCSPASRSSGPEISKSRTRYVYYPHGSVAPASPRRRVQPPISIEADVDVPAGGAEGVLGGAGR